MQPVYHLQGQRAIVVESRDPGRSNDVRRGNPLREGAARTHDTSREVFVSAQAPQLARQVQAVAIPTNDGRVVIDRNQHPSRRY